MKKELRVYLLDLHDLSPDTRHSELSDNQFITLAEEQGTVYSLGFFTTKYNTNQLDGIILHTVIRIL